MSRPQQRRELKTIIKFAKCLSSIDVGGIPPHAGFSLGGLVDGVTASLASLTPAPMPAFAGGGAVLSAPAGNSGRPVVIHLDGRPFNLSAEDSVAEALTRTALSQRRRRAGRMPGWFGG